mmetsp:Transcript_10661/g.18738  ORF Transcript_10661/g.18738 Transcript_10661/m.18738 type:complete len:453 (-) Transcript_10661:759-2117(-)
MPAFLMKSRWSHGGLHKKLLTKVVPSLRHHQHRRRISQRKLQCHYHRLTGLAIDLKQNPYAVVRTFSNSASSKPQLTTNTELSAIVNQFPPGIDYAFGYGSGVLRQQPSSTNQTNDINANPGMIDIILATENPHAWHQHNLERHSDHYSLMARIGGSQFVTWLQLNFGAKLYFHPFVNMNIDLDGERKISVRREIKYGVVSTDDLIQDLTHWDYLYLAGRMHKPIVSIDLPREMRDAEGPDSMVLDRSDEIENAQRTNLLSAVSASLLLQNASSNGQSSSSIQSFPFSHLFSTIASLSYTGDFRMQTGAEDPNKVKKLVETPGMSILWEKKYSETIGKLHKLGLVSVVDSCQRSDNSNHDGGKNLELDVTDVAIRKQLVQNLPSRLRKHSDQIVGVKDSADSIPYGSEVLRQELASIVAPAAKSQSVKGFFTAGMLKSWKYAMAKFAKGSSK